MKQKSYFSSTEECVAENS